MYDFGTFFYRFVVLYFGMARLQWMQQTIVSGNILKKGWVRGGGGENSTNKCVQMQKIMYGL